ncbi:MAG: thioredoxin [Burkholderiaceae bacterium]
MKPATRRQLLIALLLSPRLLHAQRSAAEDLLPPLDDLRVLASLVVRHKAPLLILFSTPGCPYCREVRRNYLAPRVAEQADRVTPELLLRETDITSERTLTDLSGGRITEAAFALRHHVRVVPVVTLLDSLMRPIGEPLVGLDRSGFYEAYLASAIAASRKYLRQTS